MELHHYEIGSGQRPLIFLHGLFGNAKNWWTAATTLAKGGAYRCILVDQRNHGLSPHDDAMDYPLMAQDTIALADRLGLQTFTIIGHSMGGKTAMETSLANPERVSALVAVDIAPRAYEPGFIAELEALRSVNLDQVTSRSDVDEALKGAVPSQAMRQFFLTNLVRGEDGRYRWRVNLEAVAANEDSIWAAVTPGKSYHGPTLFIRGADSDFVTEAALPTMKDLFPNHAVKTIAGAGHWVVTDKPEAFVATLSRFLQSTESAPSA